MTLGKRVAKKAIEDRKAHKKSRAAPVHDISTRRITRGMATDAACKAVFNTSELLERIIVHLPMKNIFVIPRVSQQFQGVISTSPGIQTKLFLRPRGAPAEKWMLDPRDRGPVPGQDVFTYPIIRKVDPNEDANGTLRTPVALNPLFKFAPFTFSSAKLRMLFGDCEIVESRCRHNRLETHPSFLKMYITDPPCHEALAEITAQYQFGFKKTPIRGTATGEAVRSDGGLTIGDVLLARGEVKMTWIPQRMENYTVEDSQLEEAMHDTPSPVVASDDSYPKCMLQLFDVIVPTDKERDAVSSGHQGVVSQ